MRFLSILLTALFLSTNIALAEKKAEKLNCWAIKKSSPKYLTCKAKQAGSWFKKKAKGAGKKIGDTDTGKKIKEFKKKKTLMD